jgi:hypothetical protein
MEILEYRILLPVFFLALARFSCLLYTGSQDSDVLQCNPEAQPSVLVRTRRSFAKRSESKDTIVDVAQYSIRCRFCRPYVVPVVKRFPMPE